MLATLGKRKRQNGTSGQQHVKRTVATPKTQDEDSESEKALQRILQRHFEAQFQPLPEAQKSAKQDAAVNQDNDDSGSGSGFEGFDHEDNIDINMVQIIDYSAQNKMIAPSKAEVRAFMNAKPPPVIATTERGQVAKVGTTSEDAEDTKLEKLNLKNDLELQRLISESHLLDPSTQAAATNHRQKVLDMRMKALGSKKSLLKQEKMPMTHRKGIIAKAKDKEGRRRREAKDNGIVLEKEVRDTKPEKKRVRGVTGPSMGKFAGGMLKLSKRDVASITGPRKVRRK